MKTSIQLILKIRKFLQHSWTDFLSIVLCSIDGYPIAPERYYMTKITSERWVTYRQCFWSILRGTLSWCYSWIVIKNNILWLNLIPKAGVYKTKRTKIIDVCRVTDDSIAIPRSGYNRGSFGLKINKLTDNNRKY